MSSEYECGWGRRMFDRLDRKRRRKMWTQVRTLYRKIWHVHPRQTTELHEMEATHCTYCSKRFFLFILFWVLSLSLFVIPETCKEKLSTQDFGKDNFSLFDFVRRPFSLLSSSVFLSFQVIHLELSRIRLHSILLSSFPCHPSLRLTVYYCVCNTQKGGIGSRGRELEKIPKTHL